MKKVNGIVYAMIVLFISCSPNNVKEDISLEKFFVEHHTKGTFGLFDNGQGSFIIYNIPRFRDSAYLPASTFKIVNALIGLETGRVKDERVVFKWDGKVRPIAEWNKDLMMIDAFRVSAVPWFQELARRIGRDTMQHWLDTLGYGSRFKKPVISIQNLDTFWLDNSVKVTADEQLGLVKKLYFMQLPFQNRSQRLVDSMMLMENNANYRLSYKTGWGTTENGNALGWITGWIEENKHPYFFVLQLESTDPDYDMPSHRIKMLRDILRTYGFFEGKK
ncbi:MAG TPA: penicillin-binding transpeptidase domain-containing protein [Flavitalea sp.]|nr:penicillin-binding transpeptidase domain-containing protein [Flavitalea sp.]